ncbi:MAG: carboxymuconolactone decarboxylase family protein [Planctomycetota bacterium]|nr:carboxymuconolactone decarboxylase family protein [Planctomycetota bacterium]
MAWIEYVRNLDFPDSDNILQIHGVSPDAMQAHLDLYLALMRRPGPLSRVQRERIAVAVSEANGCEY